MATTTQAEPAAPLSDIQNELKDLSKDRSIKNPSRSTLFLVEKAFRPVKKSAVALSAEANIAEDEKIKALHSVALFLIEQGRQLEELNYTLKKRNASEKQSYETCKHERE